jgi:hypothetical protein
MKYLSLILMIIFTGMGFAQIPDRTQTNCDGESRSVYAVGEEGKPLIIASKGFDCSICMNHADDLISLAKEYQDLIEVWAAMTFTYSPNVPNCGDLVSWESQHGWSDLIFSFIDQEEYWLGTGTPKYIVIHPETHEIAYSGSSFGNAFNVASDLAPMNAENVDTSQNFDIIPLGGSLRIQWKGKSQIKGSLWIFNIVGQRIQETNLVLDAGTSVDIRFNGNPGVYMATLKTDSRSESHKFIVPSR